MFFAFKINRGRTLLRVLGIFLLSALLAPSITYAGYDDGARYAFTASPEERSIYVIDLHKKQQVDTIQLDSVPQMISASENLKALIVASPSVKGLILIDLMSDKLNQYSYPLDLSPDAIYVSPIGTVAIYDRKQQILEVHAVKRRQVLMRAENIRSSGPFTFNLDGSTLYWVDQQAGAINAIDLWSKRQTLTLSSQQGALSALTRSTDGLLGFISVSRENKVKVIDLRRFKQLAEIRVGSDPGRPWGTADGAYMLIPNSGDGSVTAISTSTLRALYTIDTVASPMAINPGWLDTTAAVIGEGGEIAFIDVVEGAVRETYNLKSAPHQGVVTSDSKTLAVPVADKGAISFFDMRERSLTHQISGLPNDIGTATVAVSNNLCH